MEERSSITKTITQHTEILPDETMVFLRGIAADYAKVMNYVYQRYGGVRSVGRLTPVYTILNEMRSCGLRKQLNLPAVYYELAVADAVTDIKSNWGVLKNKINDLISQNENLTQDERSYIRIVLKINSTFSAILNREPYELPDKAKALAINPEQLNNRIRRLVRRYLTIPHTESAHLFRVSPNGYRYDVGGILLVGRIPRKRVFVPLKDRQTYDRQILFALDEHSARLNIPVETPVREHEDYNRTVYMHIGNKDMFTLSDGTVYGEGLEELVFPETLRMERKNRERDRLRHAYEKYQAEDALEKAAHIEDNNLGRQKYNERKARVRARTQTFINAEINRMIREQKPGQIVIARRVTKGRSKKYSRTANLKIARSFQGYIRKRLEFKCRIHSIKLIELNSKGTGSQCASCGSEGKRWKDRFTCAHCGNETSIALNTAKNLEKKCLEKD